MNMNNIKNGAENTAQELAKNAKETACDAKKEVIKSGKDWLNYVETHPLQTMLFGIIGYFALKGMCKD